MSLYDVTVIPSGLEVLSDLQLMGGAPLLFGSIDHLTIPSRRGKDPLRRIAEVFDCWFESGSMPYAQVHYPFESKREFEGAFPADFIAEGIDQTRGWYVAHSAGSVFAFILLSNCLLSACGISAVCWGWTTG